MARWTAKVFVDSTVGEITANVEACTHEGARQQIERIYGPTQQIVNLRQVNGGNGGGGSSSGGAGCLPLLVIVGIIAAAIGGGGTNEKQNRPTTPPESLSQPQSVVEYDDSDAGLPFTYEEFPAPEYTPEQVAPVYETERSDIRDQRRNGRDR